MQVAPRRIASTVNMDPRLTIVATSRNDDHGGDLLRRMQIFVDGVISHAKQFEFGIELILVEWNPPEERPRLIDALVWPQDTGPCRIRIIEVPAEVHYRLRHAEGLPLFQMIAKNVGIVRATAEFVLSTNVDIIFSRELMSFLSSGQLGEGHYYRVDRYDVSEYVYKYSSFEEILAACDDHVIRKCYREGIKDYRKDEDSVVFPHLPFVGKRLHLIPGRKVLIELQKKQWFRVPYLLLGKHRYWLRLHTTACGDFTLMSKQDWFRIRGAPELELFSLHLDSFVCFAAHYAGIKETVLESPIYHIEHKEGWTPEAEKDRSLYKRLERAKVPVMSIDELDKHIAQMHRMKEPLVLNGPRWGLMDEDLVEEVVG